ncbi:MAG: enoyl-CoA hydratase/isomerase family protein [Myxococcota bacterium]
MPHVWEGDSPLGDTPFLAVALDGGEEVPQSEWTRLRAHLAELTVPSIALAPDVPDPANEAWLDAFDVVVASRGELAPLVDRVRRAPLAAMVLIQLLRGAHARGVHAGLVAESLAYSTLQGGAEFTAWLREHRCRGRRAAAQGPAVITQRSGSRLEITLNRPERHNAFSTEMRDALVEALEVAVVDAALDEIVLRGAGPSFCSGGDLTEFGSFPDAGTAHAIRCLRSPARLLARCGERVRCELHGACVGAGIELPAFAHRVVAHENSFFELPEVGMGLIPGAGGTVSLPRRIGRQRTARLALSGMRLDAATALGWGLIDAIVD